MDLLSWLIVQAYKLYDWFGDSYDHYISVVNNVYDWIVNNGEWIYDRAVTYIGYIAASFNGLLDSAKNELRALINNLRNDASSAFTILKTWVQAQITNVQALIANTVKALIDPIYKWVIDQIQWLLTIRDKILQLVAVFTWDFLSKVLLFITQFLPTVIQFINDPVKFMYDLIWPSFVTFLCFVLAYALGTVSEPLPKKPDWRK